MEMGSTLLDSRPPMPHKPFPTTSSFRVTNGFEVSANSSSQHAFAPPHHTHALPHHAPFPDRAHPPPPRHRFPSTPGDDEDHAHCHTEPPIMHPVRGDGSVVGCISPQPTTAARPFSNSSDGGTKGQLVNVCGAPLPAHGRCHSSGSALHTSMPPLKVPRDAPRAASQISAAAKAAAAAAETTPPPAPSITHHLNHHNHNHHHSSASKPRGRLAGRLREAEAAASPMPEAAIGHHKAKQAATTTSPVSADQLGWKGLLEFSRSSGAAGVLGPGAGSVEGERQQRSAAQIEICCTAHTNTRVRHLVKSVIRGLKACQEPERPREGMGGTYFFMNENGRKVGILKPCDEEPLAPNNPKGYVGRQLGDPGWKPTVRVGEAAMREVAAYLLDHDGWAKVPTSVLVRARHPIFCYNNRMSSVRASSLDLAKDGDEGKDVANAPSNTSNPTDSSNGGQPPLPMKLGSLQEFVWHECDTSEMGTSRFSASDVHRIGILDIRLFNTDRHAGNMLVRMPREQSSANLKSRIADSQYELIPIDHGFCLPETLEAPYFEWLHWPQAMLPFSEEELAYIRRIDIEADKELLRKELPNLRPECLRVLEISTMLLKSCAEAGLTLFEIASIMTRPFEGGGEELSDLEKFASYARSTVEALGSSTESSGESEASGSDGESSADENGGKLERGNPGGNSDVEEGLPLSTILDNVREHGPYYGGSSPDAGDEKDVLFDFDEASDTLGRNNSGANQDPFLRYYQMSRSPTSSSSLSSADRLSSLGTSNARSSSFPYPINEDATPPPRPTFSSSKRHSGTFGSRNGRKHNNAGGMSIGRSEATPIPPSPTPSPFANGPPAMPSSVHITDGFLWRRLKGRQATHAKRRRAGVPYKHAGPKHLLSPQAYPPPIVAFAPDSLCGLFSNMDDNQWARFTCLVQEQVDAGLRSQQWKQERSKENVAPPMSCPRF